ncbi:hypothetical protein FRC02_001008 [Tulasnella sp. 418]|nr:hypothetical protein FRC02_001008 [Tulasnella sp. 418]
MSATEPPSSSTTPQPAPRDGTTASSTIVAGGSEDKDHTKDSTSITKRSSSPHGKRNSSVPAKRVKLSFWQSLTKVLLPCASSARKHHDIDEGPIALAPAAQKSKSDSQPAEAKSTETEGKKAKEKEKEPESSVVESKSPPKADSSAGKSSSTAAVPAPIQIPNTAEEIAEDVSLTTVPPSPSKLLPKSETEGVTSGAVQPPGSTGGESHNHHPAPTTTAGTVTTESDDGSFTDEVEAEAGDNEAETGAPSEDEDDEEERLIMQGGTGIPIIDGKPTPLLPPVSAAHKGRKCLVLDLDETLLHSSFKLIPQADYVVPVEIEWQWHNVYVIKRPGVDNFLKKMGELYEVVIFTASLSKYADPVLDKLDTHKVVAHRLFRESCYNHKGNYVKDLSRLGRPIQDMIILDNSPASYIFHPNNAVPVSSWFNDPHDTELTDLCPFLTDLMTVDDVRGVLDGGL